jgi:hypothetical protein
VIRPVVDKKYALDAVPEALAYVESGRAAGKVVVEAIALLEAIARGPLSAGQEATCARTSRP